MNEDAREQLRLMKVLIGYDTENPLVKKMQSALDLAIQSLEQTDVLDKIRNEITTMPCAITPMREIYVNRDKVINIIDKWQKVRRGKE